MQNIYFFIQKEWNILNLHMVKKWNEIIYILYFSLQGRCNREKPPCKYFHPPQHLKDQLLINGRNHLALKNALMQQMGYMTQPFLAGQYPTAMVRLLFFLKSTNYNSYVVDDQVLVVCTFTKDFAFTKARIIWTDILMSYL